MHFVWPRRGSRVRRQIECGFIIDDIDVLAELLLLFQR